MSNNDYASELHKLFFGLHETDKVELSSGICEFGIPSLYTNCIIDELKSSGALKRYAFFHGFLPLLSAIKFYEKAVAVQSVMNIP